MAEPMKQYRVTLTFDLDVHAIDQSETAAEDLAANQALINTLLSHPDLKTRFLPLIVAGRMEVQKPADFCEIVDLDPADVDNALHELIAEVPGVEGESLRQFEEDGFLYEFTEPYSDALVLTPVALTIEEK